MRDHPKASSQLMTAAKEFIRGHFGSLKDRELNLLGRTYIMGVLLSTKDDPALSAAGEELRASVHEYLCNGLNHNMVGTILRRMDEQMLALIRKLKTRTS